MGLGKFFGDYLSDRGIGGALEDANSIKEGLSKLFGGGSSQTNNDIDEETYQAQYRQNWDDTIEKVNGYLRADQFDEAREQLDAFYDYYEEEHDWWYMYHSTRILACEFEHEIAPILEDDNREIELRPEYKAKYRKLKGALKQLADTAEGDEEQKQAQTLSEVTVNDEFLQSLFEEHKLWREIDELTNTQHVVTDSKKSDFKKALGLLLSSDCKGRAKVYLKLLQYLIENEEARSEYQFDNLRGDVQLCADELVREAADTDFDFIKNEYLQLSDKLKAQLALAKQLFALSQVQHANKTHTNTVSANDEQEYIDELKACLADDGSISDRERRLLDKLRKSLGISEQRAAEIEASLKTGLTEEEQEYVNALKDSLMDGTISDRERRILDRLRTSLNISEERAKELEESLS